MTKSQYVELKELNDAQKVQIALIMTKLDVLSEALIGSAYHGGLINIVDKHAIKLTEHAKTIYNVKLASKVIAIAATALSALVVRLITSYQTNK